MQTFLCEPTYTITARRLDRARLGKQRVEAKQIMLALEDKNYGWQNHPAVKMWRGYEHALALYGYIICDEWRRRGYKDTLLEFFDSRIPPYRKNRSMYPIWYTQDLIDSHRANLIFKLPSHYQSLWPHITTWRPYVWPV